MIVKFAFSSKVHLDLTPCQEVKVCLTPEWAAQTVSGDTSITVKVENVTPRRLGMRSSWSRGADILQYYFSYDDAQILDNPATPGEKFVVGCSDILEVLENACVATV